MPLFHVNSREYFEGEDYFVRALGPAGSACIAGVTTTDERRSRIRQAIIDNGRTNDVLAANKDGKNETFAQRFERFFGVPFYPMDEEETIKETCDEDA